MTPFKKYSIRQKLMAMSLWASLGALLPACIAFTAYDWIAYRSALASTLSALSEIVGSNAASAVVFNDEASAAKTLASLKARPTIRAAAIYTPHGDVFAAWQRDPSASNALPALPAPGKGSPAFNKGFLTLFHPIILDEAVIGTVYIQSDLTGLKARLKRYGAIAAGVLCFSFCISILISYKVGQRISEPILHLVQVARTVSEEKKYSVRATGDSQDEPGLLIQTFNEMLAKIEADGQALRKVHEELEQRVQERTAQLSSANKELEAFSYSVSHDLRTPLRAIDGFSRELLVNDHERLNDQGKADLKRICAATQRMAQLIDDLLKLSQVTRNEMKRETIHISALVEQSLQELKERQPERRVESVIAPSLTVVADPALLAIVLENLIGNAWKFTEKRDPARIEFGLTDHEGKKAFFIRDNGAGFNMAYAGKLFGAFQRLHEAKDYPGTGIGLATVQRIIHRHGGQIWAQAEVDRGATFYFTLPTHYA